MPKNNTGHTKVRVENIKIMFPKKLDERLCNTHRLVYVDYMLQCQRSEILSFVFVCFIRIKPKMKTRRK